MKHGGVVFRRGPSSGLAFLPATIAMKVMPLPHIARVPGGPPELRGVALVDGDMIAIVNAGTLSTDAMLVCAVAGEKVGLVGIEVVATGKFDPAEAGDVQMGAEIARAFDVATLIAKVRKGRWGVTISEP
jgi:chemotaxis signal transduction protein